MKKRTFLGLMAATPVTLLTGCGGSSDGGEAKVRLLNVNPSYTGGLNLVVDDDTEATSVAYGSASSYASVSSGSVDVVVKPTGSTTELISKSYSFSSDEKYTLVVYGWSGDDTAAYSYLEDEDTPDSGEASLAILNATVNMASLDVYLTAEDEALEDSPTFASALAGGSRKAFKTVDGGTTYRLRVTGTGDTEDLRLDVSLTLESKKVYTLILSPGSSGVLLNAHLAQQGSTVTALLNTQTRVRVVSAISDYGTVAMALDGTTLQSSTKSPAASSYSLVTAGTVSAVATVNGTALSASSLTLVAGTDVTLLVTGTSAADATVTMFTDNNRLPSSSGQFKLRLVHAAPTLSDDNVTLSLAGDDTSTSNIAYGAASSYVTRDSGDNQSVVVSTQTTDVYSAETDDFSDGSVYTAFVWERGDAYQVKFVTDI